MHTAYEIIDQGAKNLRDIPRLRRAFDLAWQKLLPGAADPAILGVGLARLVLTIGSRRVNPEEIAGIAVRTFRHSANE